MTKEEMLQLLKTDIHGWNEYRLENPDLQIDLTGVRLVRADLAEANLEEADLSRADLSGANLFRADLSGANLFRADLSRADLSGANLFRANLSGADLSGATGIYSFGPIGDHARIEYAIRHDEHIMIHLGGFWGDSKAAIKAVQKKYGPDSLYEKNIELAVQILNK